MQHLVGIAYFYLPFLITAVFKIIICSLIMLYAYRVYLKVWGLKWWFVKLFWIVILIRYYIYVGTADTNILSLKNDKLFLTGLLTIVAKHDAISWDNYLLNKKLNIHLKNTV